MISPSPPQHFASKSSIRFFDIYKGNVDELNRGYVDDMSELKQYGGKAMVDSWSKPFYDTFSEPKSVQLYEILLACLK
ncbi:hypothetical protein ERO13_A01G162600v2 [Gossypium hirsutum]|nr:hypothetical protein ERO13_A01G162600v2 [Gossypium hirsutum]